MRGGNITKADSDKDSRDEIEAANVLFQGALQSPTQTPTYSKIDFSQHDNFAFLARLKHELQLLERREYGETRIDFWKQQKLLTSRGTSLVTRNVLRSSSEVLPICMCDKYQAALHSADSSHTDWGIYRQENDLHTPEEAGAEVKGASEDGKELDHAHPRWGDIEFLR